VNSFSMGNNIRKLKKEEVQKYYDIKEKLGTGSFAVVKRATRKSDGKEFAIKVIKKSKLNAEELAVVHDEVEIMHKVSHPNCVDLIEIFETSKKLYMVLELLTGGELFDRIVKKGNYSEKEASDVIRSVTSALLYLHNNGIVHRDLKPENLIYLSPDEDSAIKITDFGLAKYRSGGAKAEGMTTACGTPGYVAPEVLKNEPYGKAVDMWSLGVILYILLCGFPPFYHESTAVLYKQIKKGEYDFPAPYWSTISSSAKELVQRLLTVDPNKRFTAEQVLAHPWVQGQTASSQPLGGDHAKRLMMLQARKRLKKGVQMIIAINKFSNMLDSIKDDDTDTSTSTSTSTSASASSASTSS